MKCNEKIIDVKTFAKEYNIGVNNAYQLVHAKGFPMIRVGKKILIIRSEIDEWFVNNIGKEF